MKINSLLLFLILLSACQKNSSHEIIKTDFPVPEQSAVEEYEWSLRENKSGLEELLLYGNYDHLTPEGNLEGSITVSDDGLFYHSKEQMQKNKNLTLDEIVKKLEKMSEEELKNLEKPRENTYTISQLRSLLIDLKNKKVKATSHHENTWIYLNTESHTRREDIINVLVMMKSLDIAFKPGPY